jgi:hypothetical protein
VRQIGATGSLGMGDVRELPVVQCVGCAKRSVRTIHAPNNSVISFVSRPNQRSAEDIAARPSRTLRPWWCARFALHTLRTPAQVRLGGLSRSLPSGRAWRPCGSNADGLTIQTSLAKKLRGFQYADDGFFALLGNNGHLDLARLDVKNLISLFALGENDPAFTVRQYRFSGPDFGWKSLGIELSLG